MEYLTLEQKKKVILDETYFKIEFCLDLQGFVVHALNEEDNEFQFVVLFSEINEMRVPVFMKYLHPFRVVLNLRQTWTRD